MVASYIAFGIAFIYFWGIYYLCSKNGQVQYSNAELLLFYIFTRIVPVAMIAGQKTNIWILILLEWIILGLLSYYVYQNKCGEIRKTVFAFYLFCPVSILFIVSGDSKGMCLSVLGILLLCMADRYVKKKNGSLMQFLPEYFLVNIGMFGWITARKIMKQNFSDIFSGKMVKGNIPILYFISMVILILAVGMVLYKIISGNFAKQFLIETRADKPERNGSKKGIYVDNIEQVDGWSSVKTIRSRKFSMKDVVIMSGLTLVFAVLVLFRLGSHRVPETYQDIRVGKTGENQIVLNFDNSVKLSKVYIYLGYHAKRSISFSSKDGETAEWEVFDSNHIVESAFAWNEVAVNNRELTSLGMVLMKEDARIHEVVCFDSSGRRVLPSNANSYPEHFDEQGLFPGIATYYDQSMFDEVYHARTAYEFLYHLPIYENTHPPLGKTMISLGIRLFGMNPFGWRIVCALAGILMVPLMYLLAFYMFRKTSSAYFATVLLCTAFMNFTLARIATLDILVAFFVLLMFAFMFGFVKSLEKKQSLKRQCIWLFLSGFSTAIAISVKWTGVYAAVGLAVIYFVNVYKYIGGYKEIQKQRSYLMKLAAVSTIFFIVLPLMVYVLSYIPFTKVYTDKGLIQTAIENGKQMLSYHSVTVFEHPYSSEWYEWLWDKRPLLDAYSTLGQGRISVVATFLNPLLCWGGLIAVFYQLYLWKTHRSNNAVFLTIAYASVMMPWMFIHRTVFIYQYFLGSILLVLMIANSFSHSAKGRRYMAVTGIISVGLFILFYPVLSGTPVNIQFVNRILEWLPTWSLAL